MATKKKKGIWNTLKNNPAVLIAGIIIVVIIGFIVIQSSNASGAGSSSGSTNPNQSSQGGYLLLDPGTTDAPVSIVQNVNPNTGISHSKSKKSTIIHSPHHIIRAQSAHRTDLQTVQSGVHDLNIDQRKRSFRLQQQRVTPHHRGTNPNVSHTNRSISPTGSMRGGRFVPGGAHSIGNPLGGHSAGTHVTHIAAPGGNMAHPHVSHGQHIVNRRGSMARVIPSKPWSSSVGTRINGKQIGTIPMVRRQA